MVTLKGHVISKTGSMTGGTTVRDGSDRWEEKVNHYTRRESIFDAFHFVLVYVLNLFL